MNPEAIASEIPELSAGVLYVYFIVKAIRAWVPGPLSLFEGSRVWALVFLASLGVTWLLSGQDDTLSRAMFVQALALTIASVGADNVAGKLDTERAGRLAAAATDSRL